MGLSLEYLAVTAFRAFRVRWWACRPETAIRLALVAVLLRAGHSDLSAADSPPISHAAGVQSAIDTNVSDELPIPAVAPDRARTPIRRADDGTQSHAPRSRPASLTGSLAVLGLILGSVYVVLLWLRRRQFGQQSSAPAAIDVLASRRLDGHATLHLVRIGRRVLAIGSSPGSLHTLAVVDDPEEIALLVPPPRGETHAGGSPGWIPFGTRRGPTVATTPLPEASAMPALRLAEIDRPGRVA